MPFRDELGALRHRVDASEIELAELRAAIRACDAVLAERLDQGRAEALTRYQNLQATHDPDIRTFRVWHAKGPIIACVFEAVGIGFAISGNLRGGLFLALLGAVVLQLVSVRTIVNRRTSTFDVRLPWSPSAYEATRPIAAERITVRRDVKRWKGKTEITFAVDVGGSDLANGISDEGRARELAAELRDFVSSGRSGAAL